ncbi:hypothetical protein OIU34_23070 [Pararhizobium sp. BT-229]|uniref:hypothetical protein n=1 Tax=Pararhizobium sp. BT-229 TaxID=2986923 RepID=UPI0021F7237C|nr:hypothetical protein [Pararhizobium sp. BT-229]MCV9964777.1 hypothetical protein [Pararhizobium sp. BT-229]
MPSQTEAEKKVRDFMTRKVPLTKDNALEALRAMMDAGRVRAPSSGRNGADMPISGDDRTDWKPAAGR